MTTFRFWLVGCWFVSGLVTFSLSTPLYAHELLPAQALQFLKDHPNATPADIEAFARADTTLTASSTLSQRLQTFQAVEQRSWLKNIGVFIWLGLRHILEGADHILFVLSLVLVFQTWKDIMKLTGLFTLAHSITLILAGANLLTLPGRVVEPLIAFSITYVALTSVCLREQRWTRLAISKPIAVFFFGLFHGLGFAGLLRDIHIPSTRFLSSLVSFNLGIEFGQITVLLLVIPILLLLRRYSWYTTFIKICAYVLGATGLVWGVSRALSL